MKQVNAWFVQLKDEYPKVELMLCVSEPSNVVIQIVSGI